MMATTSLQRVSTSTSFPSFPFLSLPSEICPETCPLPRMSHRHHVQLLPSEPQPFCFPSPTSTGRLRFRRSRTLDTLVPHSFIPFERPTVDFAQMAPPDRIFTSNPFPPFISHFSTLSDFCPMTILRFDQIFSFQMAFKPLLSFFRFLFPFCPIKQLNLNCFFG
jgi:hypothetical protein